MTALRDALGLIRDAAHLLCDVLACRYRGVGYTLHLYDAERGTHRAHEWMPDSADGPVGDPGPGRLDTRRRG